MLPTSRLWFFTTSFLRYASGILYELPPPSSSSTKNGPRLWSEKPNNLYHILIKHCRHLGVSPLPLQYLSQPHPKLLLPPDERCVYVATCIIHLIIMTINNHQPESTDQPNRPNILSALIFKRNMKMWILLWYKAAYLRNNSDKIIAEELDIT